MNWKSKDQNLQRQINNLNEKVDNLPTPTEVVANPTLAGTEGDLEGLQVGNTKYKVPSGGTEVVANPTLAGTESDLESLQVGDTKYKVPSGTEVVANPTLAGTESDLEGLQVGNTKYKVPTPTEVVANPTLAGTESDLTGLQVGNTKYKVPSGGGNQKYLHKITLYGSDFNLYVSFDLINSKSEAYTVNNATLYNDFISVYGNKFAPCSGATETSNFSGLHHINFLFKYTDNYSSILVKIYDETTNKITDSPTSGANLTVNDIVIAL